MGQRLILNYLLFSPCGNPDQDSSKVGRINCLSASVQGEFAGAEGVLRVETGYADRYVRVNLHIQVQPSGVGERISQSTSKLVDIAQRNGFKGDESFYLNGSKLIPQEEYAFELEKRALQRVFGNN